jgi:hypothetical protein
MNVSLRDLKLHTHYYHIRNDGYREYLGRFIQEEKHPFERGFGSTLGHGPDLVYLKFNKGSEEYIKSLDFQEKLVEVVASD